MTPIKAALALALIATPVTAQQRNCAPRDSVVERLASKYGETRQSVGISERGMMVETWANRGTGSWTSTVTSPYGQTCLVASGQAWEELAEALPPMGKDGSKMR